MQQKRSLYRQSEKSGRLRHSQGRFNPNEIMLYVAQADLIERVSITLEAVQARRVGRVGLPTNAPLELGPIDLNPAGLVGRPGQAKGKRTALGAIRRDSPSLLS